MQRRLVRRDRLRTTRTRSSGDDLYAPVVEDHPALGERTSGYSDATSVGGLARILHQRICGRA